MSPSLVSELADTEQLPVKFLEQIMQALKDAKLVTSARGKFGGYRLAKPAKAITIGEVVRLIDGPLAPIGCVSQSAYGTAFGKALQTVASSVTPSGRIMDTAHQLGCH